MAKNHRRKYPKHANERYLSPGSWHWTINQSRTEDQRLYWHKDRQRTRRHIHNEEWDEISLPTNHRHSVLWNMH